VATVFDTLPTFEIGLAKALALMLNDNTKTSASKTQPGLSNLEEIHPPFGYRHG
jgi:hypothetical protein